jgi:glutamyl-tRNA reductase
MAEARQLVFLLGANHRSASIPLRERLHLDEDRLRAFLPEVKERFGFLELAALSTCNRFELMGVAPETPQLAAVVYDAYLDLARRGDAVQHFGEDEVRKSLYLHVDAAAIMHVYRVASSLDSLVIGETQITGQFKDALALAAQARTLGPLLGRLGQEALGAAKKVRTQTAIGKRHVSISHAAIDLAKRVFRDLSAHKFLILGAGEMAQVAAKYILSYDPRALFVANRTLTRARTLVTDLGKGEAFGIDEVPSLLVDADIVVAATAAPGFVLEAKMIQRAMSARRGRPMILLDVALPRDIDPACGKLEDVYLFDIDDLNQVVGANYEERRKAAEEAEQLIARSAEAFHAWRRTMSLKPALAAFRGYLGELVEREAQRTLSRDMFKGLEPKQREALTALLEAVAGKVASDAARRVTAPPEGYYPEQMADALTALFGLTPPAAAAVKSDAPPLTVVGSPKGERATIPATSSTAAAKPDDGEGEGH